MRLNYISKVVISAEYSKKEQIKRLKPEERKLLLICCDILENRRNITSLSNKEKEIKQLIKKLEDPSVQNFKNCKGICHGISSIFKAIANAFHLRIGIKRLNTTIHTSYDRSFGKNPFSASYAEIISNLMRMNLSPPQHHVALKTIESFFLLHLYGSSWDNQIMLGVSISDYIKEKTGLTAQINNHNDFELIKKAHLQLINKYQEAKKSNKIKEFFEQAFHSEDKSLHSRYQRILNFGIGFVADKEKNKPEEKIFEKIDKPVAINAPKNFVEHQKNDISQNIQKPDLIQPPKEKYEVVCEFFTPFLENQLEKYLKDFNYKDPQPEEIEQIGEKKDFLEDYANIENFEDYLVNEVKIIGVEQGPKKITREELSEIIHQLSKVDVFAQKKEEPKIKQEDLGNQSKNIKAKAHKIELEQAKIEEPVIRQKELEKQLRDKKEEVKMGPDHVPDHNKVELVQRPLNNKHETLLNLYAQFLQKQTKKYSKDPNKDLNSDEIISILQKQDFLNDYANIKNFKNFLDESKILGKVCKDGVITDKELEEFNNYLFEIGFLKKEVGKQEAEKAQPPLGNIQKLDLIQFSPKDKEEILNEYYYQFLSIQIKNYTHAVDIKTISGEQIEKVFSEMNFWNHQASLEKFEKYLHEETKILEIECKDGRISKEELPVLINKKFAQRYVNLKKVEELEAWKKEFDMLVKMKNDLKKDKPNLQAVEQQEKSIKPIEKINEFKEPYDQMIKDLNAYKDKLSFGQYLYLLQTINGFYKISLHRKEIWEYTKNPAHTWVESRAYGLLLTGLIIHTEDKKNNTEMLLNTSTAFLLETYKEAKAKGRTYEFFTKAFDSRLVCLEIRYSKLTEWVEKESQRENPKWALRPPKIKINPIETKSKNLDVIFRDFQELQARKFAKKQKIKINADWNKEKGTKFEIVQKDEFEVFCNKHKFVQKLKRLKLVGKSCSDGKFTQKDLDDYVKVLVDDTFTLAEGPEVITLRQTLKQLLVKQKNKLFHKPVKVVAK